jgi:hypothetical protein
MVQAMGRSGSVSPARIKPDGSFEIWRPMPGKYALSAVVMGPVGEEMRTAAVEVEVTDTSIEGIVLSFAPPIDISGRVEEDGAPPSGPAQQGLQAESRSERNFPRALMLSGTMNQFRSGGRADIADDGTFALKQVAPDRYTVNMNLPQGYVKAIRVGQTETAGPVVDLRQASGDTEVTVVIGYARGEISGTVRADGEAAGTVVLVFPDDDPFGGGFRFGIMVNRDGSYTHRNVPPGKYKLLAIAPNQQREFDQSRDLEPYVEFIETVEVRAGETTTKDLRKYVEEEK